MLYHWNPAALGIYNQAKQSPLATARSYGNPHIAEHIERLEIAQLPKPTPQGKVTGAGPSKKGTSPKSSRASNNRGGVKSTQQLTKGSVTAIQNSLLFESQRSQHLQEASKSRSSEKSGKGSVAHSAKKALFSLGGEALYGQKGVAPKVQAPRDQATAHGGHPGVINAPTSGNQRKAGKKTSTPVSDRSQPAVMGGWLPLSDLTIEIPPPPPMFDRLPAGLARTTGSSQSTPSATSQRHTASPEGGPARNMRLLKRTSVEVLPGYLDFSNEVSNNISTKNAKTTSIMANKCGGGAKATTAATAAGTTNNPSTLQQIATATTAQLHTTSDFSQGHGHFPGQPQGQAAGHFSQVHAHPGGLRSVSSDPHLVGLGLASGSQMLLCDDNPMISVNDRDLNSPVMFMQTDTLISSAQSGLTLEDIQRETVAMETGKAQVNWLLPQCPKVKNSVEDT